MLFRRPTATDPQRRLCLTLLTLTGTTLLVLLLGVTLLVGFGADWLANRFRVPDVLWLIALGILAGPVLGLLSASSLLLVAPLLGVAALVLILFDAGLDLRLSRIRFLASSAILFAIASYFVSTCLLFVAAYLFLFPGHPALSFLFAASLGCTSGAVIIPLANRLGLPAGLRSLLHIDSAVEDALAVVTVTTALALLVPALPSLAFSLTTSILLPLPVGIAIGLAAGLLWVLFLYAWQERPFAALATLGFLFVVYAVTEALGGSGILAALVFGGVLGNGEIVGRIHRRSHPFRISSDLRRIEVEIAFVLRTFFLFLIGVIVTLSTPSPVVGATVVALVILLLLVRLGAFPSTTRPEAIPRAWSTSVAAFYGRGLTSAVLLTVSLGYSSAVSTLFFPALLVIVGTNVAMTIWLFLARRTPVPTNLEVEDLWAAEAGGILAFAPEVDVGAAPDGRPPGSSGPDPPSSSEGARAARPPLPGDSPANRR